VGRGRENVCGDFYRAVSEGGQICAGLFGDGTLSGSLISQMHYLLHVIRQI
jgi:hypothetical protein